VGRRLFQSGNAAAGKRRAAHVLTRGQVDTAKNRTIHSDLSINSFLRGVVQDNENFLTATEPFCLHSSRGDMNTCYRFPTCIRQPPQGIGMSLKRLQVVAMTGKYGVQEMPVNLPLRTRIVWQVGARFSTGDGAYEIGVRKERVFSAKDVKIRRSEGEPTRC